MFNSASPLESAVEKRGTKGDGVALGDMLGWIPDAGETGQGVLIVNC